MRYISGLIYDGQSFSQGYVGINGGKIVEKGDGCPPEEPFTEGVIIPGLANAHTHVADAGLEVPKNIGLEELVSPPNGLKHKYLRETSDEKIGASIKKFTDVMFFNGITGFADFREGGLNGCRLLTSARTKPKPMILGRPVSPEYDWNEVDAILKEADGIGLSSISDMNVRYIEKIAEHVHSKKKTFAIHASERIREDIDQILNFDPTFVVHMTRSTKNDIRKCSDALVPIVVCMRSNMLFGNIPPIKEMMKADIKIALGTDNAMLCSPDIRAEANVFLEVLGKEYSNDANILRIIINNGREILYRGTRIGISAGMDTDIAVFPSSGRKPLSDILDSTGRTILNISKRSDTRV